MFREGEGKERERYRNINMWLPLMYPPTEDLNRNLVMCPQFEWIHRPCGSQAHAQSTKPLQPRLSVKNLIISFTLKINLGRIYLSVYKLEI